MARKRVGAAALAVTLAASLLGGASAHAAGRTPSDLPPVSAGDVMLYIDDEPCGGATEGVEVMGAQAALLLAHLACCGGVAAFAGAHGSHSRPGVCRIGCPAHSPGVLRYENCLDERVQPVQVNIGEDW